MKYWKISLPFLVCLALLTTANSARGDLIGTSLVSGDLFGLNSQNGSTSPISSRNGINALGYDSRNNISYAIRTTFVSGSSVEELVTFDASTGVQSVVGNTGLTNVLGNGDLAFDPFSGTLYATNPFGLYELDTATGDATLIGSFGFMNLQGIAFDTQTRTLLGSDIFFDQLYSIDVAAGTTTVLGALDGITDLAFDRETNQLFGISPLTAPDFSDELVRVNKSNGSVALVGSTGLGAVVGLASTTTAVPEPSCLSLLGLGSLAFFGRRRRALMVHA